MINEYVDNNSKAPFYREYLIPDTIQQPYEMRAPFWYKPSKPRLIPHPLIKYGVREEEGKYYAWFELIPFQHRYQNDMEIVINGTQIVRRSYYFLPGG